MANKQAAKRFANEWKNRGDEKQDTQSFWISLLQQVFGVGLDGIQNVITFEVRTSKQKKGKDFKDAVLYRFDHDKEVLIEQKSFGISLAKQIKQSDGELLTPFEQAKRYDDHSAFNDKARWIICCNFGEFWIYDMSLEGAALYEPVKRVDLADLPNNLGSFTMLESGENDSAPKFNEEVAVSVKAGNLVGKMYDAFEKQYKHDEDGNLSDSQRQALNKLCVRLVFCLYAEDSGLFRDKQFHDYMESYPTLRMRRALIDLFNTLNTPIDQRDPYLEADVASFPYVNGGLFAGEIEVPNFTDDLREVLLDEESSLFDWSAISPTIFGAVFESTLNPETRRSGGMHYTSIENIHRVIGPLFLDDLKAECDRLLSNASTTNAQLRAFQNKLASLTFLDPACGSGNFLTETYLSLRRLENRVIQAQSRLMQMGNVINPIKVSIQQFYGIEVNDFAVSVAQTALWIAEHKEFKETEKILFMDIDFLPLKTFTHIWEGDALKIDWSDVIPSNELSYIMGNPPFVANAGRVSREEHASKKVMDDCQKEEKKELFGADGGVLDYVCCWYKKASLFIKGTNIHVAFVSTDSICQGQQIAPLWESLLSDNVKIDFAYKSFKWDAESSKKATVYVVIIGFSETAPADCKIYYSSEIKHVKHISPYLIPSDEDILVRSTSTPLCDVPQMRSGGKPVEGGNLIFSEDEKNEFIKKEPNSEKFFKPFMGSEDYLNNNSRWCLWLLNAEPRELKSMPLVMQRIEAVRNFRLSSKKAATREGAKFPQRFMEIKQSDGDYLMIPLTTSRNRKYIPIGYLSKDVIASNAASFVPNATLYHFGVLISIVHMAWMRTVAGYFGPSYRYSNNIVYNTFPWPSPSDSQKSRIEQTAQAILDARAMYPSSTLSDLYDPLTMPAELRKAHDENDKAVMCAYGFNKNMAEEEIVLALMKMYKTISSEAGI